jgi:hypothetical protein
MGNNTHRFFLRPIAPTSEFFLTQYYSTIDRCVRGDTLTVSSEMKQSERCLVQNETFQRQCKWCGKDYEAHNPRSETCSNQCRLRFHRWRHGLALAVARANAALSEIHSYTEHPWSADEAWTSIFNVMERCSWYLGTLGKDGEHLTLK